MDKDKRNRFPFKCPVCGSELWAGKSIAQEMGMLDAGYGKCIKCGTSLNLTIDKENKKMIAITWEEYIKKRRCDNK